MSTTTDDAQQFDPSAHTVPEVQEYLATADDTERQRVLDAERDGKARTTLLDAPQEPAEGPQDGPETTEGTTTRGTTFQAAAEATEVAERGYLGTSPEAERTGRRDKGLSQRNPAVMNGGPVPDARTTVDDSAALSALRQDG